MRIIKKISRPRHLSEDIEIIEEIDCTEDTVYEFVLDSIELDGIVYYFIPWNY